MTQETNPEPRLSEQDPLMVCEIDNGFLIERRRLLWLPAAVTVTLMAGAAPRSNAGTRGSGELGWQAFIDNTSPEAALLHEDTSARGQDAYVLWLAAMAARLRHDSIPSATLASFANLDPQVETGLSYRGALFFVIEWKMSPHAKLPPHNHPNISVCTLCVAGSARIRNFNTVGESPEFSSTVEFRVQETHDEVLTAGRLNTLSAVRDNIHTFTAGPEGARGIDITTYHGPDRGFAFLDLDEEPTDTEARLYRAAWRLP